MSPTDRNIVRHEGRVLRADRERLMGQRGCVLWFTGLSGSGKSTVARAVEEECQRRGDLTYVLDGDNLRHGLNSDLGFSPEDRVENIRRVGEVAALFADAGVVVITAFISPYRKDRELTRDKVGAEHFLEIHVDAPLATCEARDPKGLYARARAGDLAEFTGISAPYEAPEQPALRLETADQDVATCAAAVLDLLARRGIIRPQVP